MLKSLFVCGVLGALLIPAECDTISVCVEEDEDLRVDCKLDLKPNIFNSYEFSWSSGTKETLINTNVSGSATKGQLKQKSYVEELEPQGYRLTLSGITDPNQHNTTYICKISGDSATVTIEAGKLLPCSAVRVFVKSSCSWIACLLLFYHTQS